MPVPGTLNSMLPTAKEGLLDRELEGFMAPVKEAIDETQRGDTTPEYGFGLFVIKMIPMSVFLRLSVRLSFILCRVLVVRNLYKLAEKGLFRVPKEVGPFRSSSNKRQFNELKVEEAHDCIGVGRQILLDQIKKRFLTKDLDDNLLLCLILNPTIHLESVLRPHEVSF